MKVTLQQCIEYSLAIVFSDLHKRAGDRRVIVVAKIFHSHSHTTQEREREKESTQKLWRTKERDTVTHTYPLDHLYKLPFLALWRPPGLFVALPAVVTALDGATGETLPCSFVCSF